MQKMLRIVLVYIIKHLWNMWKARGLLRVLSTLHNGNCKNLCKFHMIFSKMCCQSNNFKWFSTMWHLWGSARGESHKIQRAWKDTTFLLQFPTKKRQINVLT